MADGIIHLDRNYGFLVTTWDVRIGQRVILSTRSEKKAMRLAMRLSQALREAAEEFRDSGDVVVEPKSVEGGE